MTLRPRKPQGIDVPSSTRSTAGTQDWEDRALTPDQYTWLSQVLRGHYAYYGLPNNFYSLRAFYQLARNLWYRALRRRSQRGLTWDSFKPILERFTLPRPTITHPLVPRLA